jgi:hypothetical protein
VLNAYQVPIETQQEAHRQAEEIHSTGFQQDSAGVHTRDKPGID